MLDPEQNNAFHDNYLDVDYDLSHVMFIATANDLNTIPRPLLDRMEIIEVSGYITEEKIEIAKRHLVPRELENTGLDTNEPKIKFNKASLEKIIEQYTRESGVRQLEKQVNKALRKMAFNKAMDGELTYTDITPEGATPKDGPSAGITIATSIASALTQRKVRKNTAMTGEITLRGKVLPVGGIKEKILAAKRAGITDIVMCKENKKDIDEIPEKYLKGVEFHYVENVQQVWDFALTNERVEHPVDLTIQEVPDKTATDPHTVLL